MLLLTAALLALSSPPFFSADSTSEAAIAARVEIIRTEYGVPHIYAEDLEAMGFGLAWVQSEDWGELTAVNMVKARGEHARYVGQDSIGGDFAAKESYARAVETWPSLLPETRAVYKGFAAGLRHYVRLHPESFPSWMTPDFTGLDAHAREVQSWSRGQASAFLRALRRRAQVGDGQPSFDTPAYAPSVTFDPTRDGSNAWSFNSTRTKSGRAILLRNPHLSWTAGYYEAHAVVPGIMDFYGDFRIGGAFGIVGGFNRSLGWATTNNQSTYAQVYSLEADAAHENHYMLDGRSHALQERRTTVEYRTPEGEMGTETRSTWSTPYGPVIHQEGGEIYILKDARDGEWRSGEQFLLMMRSSSLEEWLDIMRMRAYGQSNFTYADADGNIAHLYNARLPLLPHPVTDDSAVVVNSTEDMWQELVPFDDLPLYVNPPGGYTTQTNDSPDFTNLNVPMNRDTVPSNVEPVRLRLRSQLSLSLVHGDAKVSLEDVVRLKHTPRMLMAERVLDDLLAAIRRSGTAKTGEASKALHALESWDRTAAAGSRGGVLFQAWARIYDQAVDTARFYREPWTPERPMATPMGIGDPDEAVSAFEAAMTWMDDRNWAYDMPWGDAFRVIRGDVDEPVSGCSGTLGCFRTLSFQQDPSGRFAARSGDGWILAVEFGDVPRAYSVLAYGESNQEDSPHFADQAALFAHEGMKTVAFTYDDVQRTAVRRYRPGAGG